MNSAWAAQFWNGGFPESTREPKPPCELFCLAVCRCGSSASTSGPRPFLLHRHRTRPHRCARAAAGLNPRQLLLIELAGDVVRAGFRSAAPCSSAPDSAVRTRAMARSAGHRLGRRHAGRWCSGSRRAHRRAHRRPCLRPDRRRDRKGRSDRDAIQQMLHASTSDQIRNGDNALRKLLFLTTARSGPPARNKFCIASFPRTSKARYSLMQPCHP